MSAVPTDQRETDVQLEPFEDTDGRRCWLSRTEQATLLDFYGDENLQKRLAVELGLDGLRADERTRVVAGE